MLDYFSQESNWHALGMTIDPGINGTGVAIWRGKELINLYSINSNKLDWLSSAFDIAGRGVIQTPIEWLAFEMPANFASSTASIAAGKKGDILKLSILIGMIISKHDDIIVLPVTVQSWKGNMEKKMMNERTKLIYKNDKCQKKQLDSWDLTTHSVDAIGIGLYLQGKL